MDIRRTTFDRLARAVRAEFKRVGLSDEEAESEAVSFAYAAAEILTMRLEEHEIG